MFVRDVTLGNGGNWIIASKSDVRSLNKDSMAVEEKFKKSGIFENLGIFGKIQKTMYMVMWRPHVR
jgi:hypothetical protein